MMWLTLVLLAVQLSHLAESDTNFPYYPYDVDPKEDDFYKFYEGMYVKDKYGDPHHFDNCHHKEYRNNIRPGYPFFPIQRPENPAQILPRAKNAYALVDSGNDTIYRYRGHDYQRLLISQNGYIAFGDFRQSGPPSAHFLHNDGNDKRGKRVRYDMACLFCAEMRVKYCPYYANVSWRISQHPDDKQIFSNFIFNASGERWIPDKMVIVTYTDVDKAVQPCCIPGDGYDSWIIFTYYGFVSWIDRERGYDGSSAYFGDWDEMKDYIPNYYEDGRRWQDFYNDYYSLRGRYPIKDFDKRSTVSPIHFLNHYQMVLATATVDGQTRTYIIYSYGRVHWVERGYTMAGFIEKQRGDRYLAFGSYTRLRMFMIKGHGNPKMGVYAFRIDTWGPRPRKGCDLNTGWFITDWNTTRTKYHYDLA